MAILGQDCNCQVLYGVREAHFRALQADGSEDTGADWYATTCPVSVGFDPAIEEGAESVLRCGDAVKNRVVEEDTITGMTMAFAMGCADPEIEYIIAGSLGVITYDASSPPCAIGYCPPTIDEQAAGGLNYEARIYQAEMDGSTVVGYRETHLYQCLPAFNTYAGAQQEYSSPEWSIKAVENPNYDVDGQPVYCWRILAAIPS